MTLEARCPECNHVFCTAPLGLDTKRGMESWGERMTIAPVWKTEDGLPAPSFGFPSWG